MNVKKTIEAVLKEADDNWQLAEHLRLKGFHNIINGSYIDKYKVEEELRKRLAKVPDFTKLMSSSAIISMKKLVEGKGLIPIHLPINDKYHLHFFTTPENEFMHEIVYDACEDCKLVEPYEFPIMELRHSINLRGIEGSIMYDNRVWVIHQDKKLLEAQYKTFQEFINNVKAG